MNKIKVITKQPGEMPHSVWMSPELENLQGYVGGEYRNVQHFF